MLSRFLLGIVCGVVFGLVSIATMIPLTFEDKRGVDGAFVNRFAIGFVIGTAMLPVAGWLSRLIFGLLLTPGAIITKAQVPILGLGAIGGSLISIVVSQCGYEMQSADTALVQWLLGTGEPWVVYNTLIDLTYADPASSEAWVAYQAMPVHPHITELIGALDQWPPTQPLNRAYDPG